MRGVSILHSLLLAPLVLSTADIVAFPSGELALHGVLYKPKGTGPFPAVVYNHGSAPGMLSKDAFDALGPVFASHGWVFFGPYRRGQGLSVSAGPIFFFQAANDYDLSPSKTLSQAMKDADKAYEVKIYPPYGSSPQEGHTFGYFGSSVWGDDVFRFLNGHCTR
jgi:hypothetical protein